jgi:hypothetical protein
MAICNYMTCGFYAVFVSYHGGPGGVAHWSSQLPLDQQIVGSVRLEGVNYFQYVKKM